MEQTQDAGKAFDVVVIGCGAAGLASALAAAETEFNTDTGGLRIAVLERAPEHERGGNTRWTGANMRLKDTVTVADHFEEEMLAFSGMRSDKQCVRTLASEIPGTLRWIQAKGIKLDQAPSYMLTASRPRIAPDGGGRKIVEALAQELERAGVSIFHETTAQHLTVDSDGNLAGVSAAAADGRALHFGAKAVVIASGGFEGDAQMMAEHIGPEVRNLATVAPGGRYNRGEGIRMALALGARRSGQWDAFHMEPVDPRSARPEAVIMAFPYGILVNSAGERFVDEGSGTVDETYEDVTRAILSQPGQLAYLVADSKLTEIPGYQGALLTDQDPYEADSYAGLATRAAINADGLTKTIERYNAAGTGQPRVFDPLRPDGLAAADLSPPKSNWARPIDQPPYIAYPVTSGVVFTFGGIATNERAEVLGSGNSPIPGLYAAGEAAGLYYGKYPGGTSVLRCLTFGRIAGRNAITGAHGFEPH